VCGLLVPLSADKVVAGTSLGLLGFSPWLAPPVFGVITALMALVGLQIGQAVARVIPMRPDLVTGIALVVMATVMGPQI
jgi:putative Mn2+ efflux pump MntP